MRILLEKYKPRKINFLGLHKINGWDIKAYTITNRKNFKSTAKLNLILKELPGWTNNMESTALPTYKKAFLIIHEAREGLWILMNWWTGGEMIDSKVYFSSYDSPAKVIPSPYKSDALICVWELEIFAHERKAWIEHVLKNQSDFEAYLNDNLTTNE